MAPCDGHPDLSGGIGDTGEGKLSAEGAVRGLGRSAQVRQIPNAPSGAVRGAWPSLV